VGSGTDRQGFPFLWRRRVSPATKDDLDQFTRRDDVLKLQIGCDLRAFSGGSVSPWVDKEKPHDYCNI
jgi:hypothetical protein